MSHFAVFVVTPEFPTEDVLAKTLAPWHEFECTGLDNEFVVDVDKTEEARSEFKDAIETRLRDQNGILHDRFDETGAWKPEFSQPNDDKYGSLRKEFIPEGFESVEIPASDVVTFAEWASDYYGWKIAKSEAEIDKADTHKHGHILVDESGDVVRCIDRTNPNATWDWWQLGGRYSGRLAAGYDPEKDPANIETCWLCQGTGKRSDEIAVQCRVGNPEYTCNGCDGKGRSVKWPSKWTNIGNVARWGQLDMEALKAGKVAERREMVEELRQKSGLSFEDFEQGFHAYKSAKSIWLELPEPKPRGAEFSAWLKTQAEGDLALAYNSADIWGSIEADEGQSISDWIEATPAISTYAAVFNGKWCAKGEMGWFGMSQDEDEDWHSQFQKLLTTISADHYVSFVDCHI
ncbi:hypothetical protein C8J38_10843 [Rhizobium sp. PP-WC-2G-219]|nr:hypothetical protein C8J38_10843 [Rhizobium sp. PP-WC-2G-219]